MMGAVHAAYRFVSYQSTPAVLMDRVVDLNGNIKKAGIASINFKVYEAGDLSTVLFEDSIDKATTVFDTLQEDTRWQRDNKGYNFRWIKPASVTPLANKEYHIEITFTPTSGDPFVIVFINNTIDLSSKPD